MKIVFVADGRSPTAAGWISYFIEQGHAVHLVSTFPADPFPGLASFDVIPVPGAGLAGTSPRRSGAGLRRFVGPGLRMMVRRRLEAWSLDRRSLQLRAHILALEPDLVHALRIPFEGMLAAAALGGGTMAMRSVPLVVSVWGNDFTLHAGAGPGMAALTRSVLHRADALIADCQRDIRLAYEWGLPAERPTTVLPGAGGVRTGIFFPDLPDRSLPLRIVQPRGLRAYVENEAFLRAVPTVLGQYPGIRFICPGLAGSEALSNLADRLGISRAVEMLPPIPQTELADLFRRSSIVLSPTSHDGTPNSLLEALACGCFPVAGDLEAIREWIIPGENGLLVNAASPAAIAAGILSAIQDPGLRERAREINLKLVSERAAYEKVMPQAEAFYRDLI